MIKVVFQIHVASDDDDVDDVVSFALEVTILDETADDVEDDDAVFRVQAAYDPGSPKVKRAKGRNSFIVE